MEKTYDTIVLGGGASGLMLAAQLADRKPTLLIEGNARLGAKLLVSGGGRCNITNARMGADFFAADADFVAPALKCFDPHALLAWLRERGLDPVLQKKNQYFCPDSSRQIVTIFEQAVRGATIRRGCPIASVSREGTIWQVHTRCGRFAARRLVVATGGISFPKLGASDLGYRIAENLGHTVVSPRPALVGLTLQKEQAFFKELSGLSTAVAIEVEGREIRGDLLFAHKGISGPAVLDASLYWRKGHVTIDWLPDFDWDHGLRSSRQVSTVLPIPRRMAKAFLGHLELEDKPAKRLSPAERNVLRGLSAYTMAPAGTFGYSKAEVTRGGIDTAQIDPETMASRLHPGLYFVGETLDVTGQLGGYNLQWAFSSAVLCSRDLLRG